MPLSRAADKPGGIEKTGIHGQSGHSPRHVIAHTKSTLTRRLLAAWFGHKRRIIAEAPVCRDHGQNGQPSAAQRNSYEGLETLCRPRTASWFSLSIFRSSC